MQTSNILMFFCYLLNLEVFFLKKEITSLILKKHLAFTVLSFPINFS